MKNKIKTFPWFEVMLIVGLAIALIVKPQNSVFSASSQAGEPEVGMAGNLPLVASPARLIR